MKLIDDVKGAWRHFSTQALLIGASIQSAWALFPDDLKVALGPAVVTWVARVTALVLLWGLIGKFIDQRPKEAP